MRERNFRTLLEAKWAEGKFVCVGLDPVSDKIPDFIHQNTIAYGIAGYGQDAQAAVMFCNAIVDETCGTVCAYKPNSAFLRRLGLMGCMLCEKSLGMYVKLRRMFR
jgi:orotidine-5'-phosphate decarboxylase